PRANRLKRRTAPLPTATMAPPPTPTAPPPMAAMAPSPTAIPPLHELDPVLPFERVVASDRVSLAFCAGNSLWLCKGDSVCRLRGSGNGHAPHRYESDPKQDAP